MSVELTLVIKLDPEQLKEVEKMLARTAIRLSKKKK